jgi:hypothetical protein
MGFQFMRHLSSQPFFPWLVLVAVFEAAGLGLQLLAYYSVIPGDAMFPGMVIEYFGIMFAPRMLHLYTSSRYTAYAATAVSTPPPAQSSTAVSTLFARYTAKGWKLNERGLFHVSTLFARYFKSWPKNPDFSHTY